MASGVGVHTDCLKEYQDIKLGKKHKYIIYKLSEDNKEIVVDETGAINSEYEQFTNKLPELEPRWAVYDLGYNTPDGQRNKLTFISWSPDDARIKLKMLYASSKDALRRSLDGIQVEVQATAFDEVDYDSIVEKAKRGTR